MARKTFTAEEKKRFQEEIRLRKEAAEKRRLQELEEKSKIFKSPVGKVLKVLAIISAVISLLFMVDRKFEVDYVTQEILSSEKEIIEIHSSDGWAVPATFYWVYFDNDKTSGIQMYRVEYELIEEAKSLEVGYSPLLKSPMCYRVTQDNGIDVVKKIVRPFGTFIYIPGFLLVISLLWIFLKPENNYQVILFGYVNLIAIPVLLFILSMTLFGLFNYSGLYELDFDTFVIDK